MNDLEHSERLVSTAATRRAFLGGAVGTMGTLLVGRSALGKADAPPAGKEVILKKGDHVRLDGDPKAIIQRAYELGHKYEGKFGNCAQCTVAALQDALPFVPKDKNLFRAACGLDGGSTPVAVQNCGAFTGAAMILGYLTGRTRNEKGFQGGTGLTHRLTHRLYERFKKEYGTVLCRDVRKRAEGKCPEVVGRSARWAAEVLLEEFAP
jgi:C_GCAxxG_C_C family probable redox protein